MAYLLEDEKEFQRLEEQVKQKHYSLENEFKYLDLHKGSNILDAGCGSGLVSRYLLSKEPTVKITAVDYSDIRVAQAQKCSSNKAIYFQKEDLNHLSFPDNHFDVVVSRYVYEYLVNPIQVTKELYRVLKPGGKVYLIDLDGIFENFWTIDDEFNQKVTEVTLSLGLDAKAGRKLPSYLMRSNFKSIQWHVEACAFNTKEDSFAEKKNYVDRFEFTKERLLEHFQQDRNQHSTFCNHYLEYMSKFEENVLFFNKFIASGIK